MLNYFIKNLIFTCFVTNNLIKPIRQEIFFYYYPNRHLFKHTANVVLNDNNFSNKKIKFVPTIHHHEFNEKREWLYLFTIDNLIVKIDSADSGLRKCSESIFKLSSKKETLGTLEYYLQKNRKVKMYGYSLPIIETEVSILNKKVNVTLNSCELYKNIILDDFKNIYKNYPLLN